MNTLGSRLSERRNAAGLERSELGELAGLSPALVGMIERGDRTNIAATTATSLARVLGTRAEYLVDGEGDPPTDADVREAVARARAASHPGAADPTANDLDVCPSPTLASHEAA